MADDPPPPSQPLPGSLRNSPPAPALSAGSRPHSGSAARLPGSRPHSGSGTGYPPSPGGIVRSASQGSTGSRPGSQAGILRAASSGSLRAPAAGGGLGSRVPSRERLPALGSPSVGNSGEGLFTTPRHRHQQLTPLPGGLGSSSRPGSGHGSQPGSTRSLRDRGQVSVPPLSLPGADQPGGDAAALPGPGGADGSAGAAGAADVPPPPAPPSGAEDRLRDRLKGAKAEASDAPTQRGPVKWVPHTHANPKHAKFCFICLHGRLEGEKEGVDEEKRRQQEQQVADQDLPSSTDMNEKGYLVPGKRFRRQGADFERGNLTSGWLHDVSHRVYNETCRDMVCVQNEDIAVGKDVKLVDWDEDSKDREVVEKLFRLSEEEQHGLEARVAQLSKWCQAQEDRLMDVLPPARVKEQLPHVPEPNPEQKGVLEYQPLIDHKALRGETAHDARQLVREADALAGIGNFRAEDLPRPQTYPDMPEFEVVPYQLKPSDLPEYEPLAPQAPVLRPIDASIDPFQRPFLFIPDFEETNMPDFEGTAGIGEMRTVPPECVPEEWLATTFSMFEDNNPEATDVVEWGRIPPRKRLMPPLIDEPYVPPMDLVDTETQKKRILVRTLWDPELFTQDGIMVPPLRARGKELYAAPLFTHISEPEWSRKLAPAKGRDTKIRDLVKIIPVRSFSRFKPKPVEVDMPEWLWDLVRKDTSGQGIWDVIAQRHDIPRLERRQKEEEEREKLRVEEDEDEARMTAEAAERAARDQASSSDSDAESEQSDAASAEDSRPPSRAMTAEQPGGLPAMELEVPGPPAPGPVVHAHGASSASGTEAPRPQSSDGDRERALKEHQERVRGLVERGAEGRKAEQLLSDDRFIDSLADKLCQKMGGTMAPSGGRSPSATMGMSMTGGGGTVGNWSSGLRTGTETFSGAPTTKIMRPEMPSFAEPTDEYAKAELPKALQGMNAKDNQSVPSQAFKYEPVTLADVNQFTQEKMRGDCYVRLLLKPEANAARKNAVPYSAQPQAPDAGLAMKAGRPHLTMPPKEKGIDGEDDEEDDDHQDFEPNYTIAFSFVRHNRIEPMQALIEQDPEILKQLDDNGNTMLHIACQNNHRRMAKLLVNKDKSIINTKNSRENTALHYAYQYKFTDIQQYLIQSGADTTLTNSDGLPPSAGLGNSEDSMTASQKRLRGQNGS